MSMFTKASDGSIVIYSRHPKSCPTWHWSISLKRSDRRFYEGWRWSRARQRTSQWHDFYPLPFGWTLIWGAQDWHKDASK